MLIMQIRKCSTIITEVELLPMVGQYACLILLCYRGDYACIYFGECVLNR